MPMLLTVSLLRLSCLLAHHCVLESLPNGLLVLQSFFQDLLWWRECKLRLSSGKCWKALRNHWVDLGKQNSKVFFFSIKDNRKYRLSLCMLFSSFSFIFIPHIRQNFGISGIRQSSLGGRTLICCIHFLPSVRYGKVDYVTWVKHCYAQPHLYV